MDFESVLAMLGDNYKGVELFTVENRDMTDHETTIVYYQNKEDAIRDAEALWETFNEDYRMREVGAVLNWFDVTAPEGRYSLNDTIGDIMKSKRGKMWFIGMGLKIKKKMDAKKKAQKGEKKSGGRSFGDDAMTAMFIGLITAYMGSYIGQLIQLKGGALVCTGQYLQLVAMGFSALAMAVFTHFAETKKMAWLDNFSIAGSMLVGMAAAVLCGMIF